MASVGTQQKVTNEQYLLGNMIHNILGMDLVAAQDIDIIVLASQRSVLRPTKFKSIVCLCTIQLFFLLSLVSVCLIEIGNDRKHLHWNDRKSQSG